MSVDFDIDKVKKEADRFSPKKDSIAAMIQLAICFVGVAYTLIHELKKSSSKGKKK